MPAPRPEESAQWRSPREACELRSLPTHAGRAEVLRMQVSGRVDVLAGARALRYEAPLRLFADPAESIGVAWHQTEGRHHRLRRGLRGRLHGRSRTAGRRRRCLAHAGAGGWRCPRRLPNGWRASGGSVGTPRVSRAGGERDRVGGGLCLRRVDGALRLAILGDVDGQDQWGGLCHQRVRAEELAGEQRQSGREGAAPRRGKGSRPPSPGGTLGARPRLLGHPRVSARGGHVATGRLHPGAHVVHRHGGELHRARLVATNGRPSGDRRVLSRAALRRVVDPPWSEHDELRRDRWPQGRDRPRYQRRHREEASDILPDDISRGQRGCARSSAAA
mmetsp:Transcript_117507/g.339737  ORF Transcript_117507/g.339737 Transcript_117507/m.339737 type:complete len:333 (+) Transcript_117507:981-1979(+)